MTNLDSRLKSRDITLPTKVHLVKAIVFPVVIYGWTIHGELDYKEPCAPKNWLFWTVVLEKILESVLDCKEVQPVHPKGDQSWVFIGRTDVEVETPILWPPVAKSWLIWKNPDAGKGWGQEEKGTTEDEMVGWHHWLNGPGFGWTPGVGDGQGGLKCCGSWGHKELDTTERLNWTELFYWRRQVSLTIRAILSMGLSLADSCKGCFRWCLHEQRWHIAKLHHDVCAQCYKWLQLLHNHAVIVYRTWGESERTWGKRAWPPPSWLILILLQLHWYFPA